MLIFMGHVRLIPSKDHKIDKGPHITGDLSYKAQRSTGTKCMRIDAMWTSLLLTSKTFTSFSVENMMYTIF
jgi:hypothetical protein